MEAADPPARDEGGRLRPGGTANRNGRPKGTRRSLVDRVLAAAAASGSSVIIVSPPSPAPEPARRAA